MADGFIVVRTHQEPGHNSGPIAYPENHEPQDLFLRHICMEFLSIADEEEEERLLSGEDAGKTVALLDGTIILGEEICLRGEDFWDVCDACSSDLEAFAVEIQREESIQRVDPTYCNVLYIDKLNFDSEIIESDRLQELFSMIPKSVFFLYNIWPTLMGYLIASSSGYYESAADSAVLDPRSVDGYSPLIISENGFKLSSSANALFCIPEW